MSSLNILKWRFSPVQLVWTVIIGIIFVLAVVLPSEARAMNCKPEMRSELRPETVSCTPSKNDSSCVKCANKSSPHCSLGGSKTEYKTVQVPTGKKICYCSRSSNPKTNRPCYPGYGPQGSNTRGDLGLGWGGNGWVWNIRLSVSVEPYGGLGCFDGPGLRGYIIYPEPLEVVGMAGKCVGHRVITSMGSFVLNGAAGGSATYPSLIATTNKLSGGGWSNSLCTNTIYRARARYTRSHFCDIINYKQPLDIYFSTDVDPAWQLKFKTYVSDRRNKDIGYRKEGQGQGRPLFKYMRPIIDTAYWDHEWENIGPDSMHGIKRNMSTNIHTAGVEQNRSTMWSGDVGQKGEFNTRHPVTQADVGRELCQRLEIGNRQWLPPNQTSNWPGRTLDACVYVPYHYPECIGSNCKPEDDIPPKDNCEFHGNCGITPTSHSGGVRPEVDKPISEMQVGDSVSFSYQLNNKGPTISKDINYRAFTYLIKGESYSQIGNRDTDMIYPSHLGWNDTVGAGCGGRGVSWGNYRSTSDAPRGKCVNSKSGSVRVRPGQPLRIQGGSYTIDNNWIAKPGDRICTYIVLDRNWNIQNDQSANTYISSEVKCTKIGKRPQLQINGSDSYAEKGFEGGTRLTSNTIDYANPWNVRGSYSQYGLLTKDGGIVDFGSAGYSVLGDRDKHKKLAFANNGGALGYAGLRKIQGHKTPTIPDTPHNAKTWSGYGLPTESGAYTVSGNMTISNGPDQGKRIALFVKGDVYINGNVNLDGYGGVKTIPSLTVFATGNIVVSSGVTKLDGVYIAKGRFISCSSASGGPGRNSALGIGGGACNQKLVIRGAIGSGKSPYLRRTFGAGIDKIGVDQWNGDKTSTTAEAIVYTPNSWFAGYMSNGDEVNRFKTVKVTSLPVRF